SSSYAGPKHKRPAGCRKMSHRFHWQDEWFSLYLSKHALDLLLQDRVNVANKFERKVHLVFACPVESPRFKLQGTQGFAHNLRQVDSHKQALHRTNATSPPIHGNFLAPKYRQPPAYPVSQKCFHVLVLLKLSAAPWCFISINFSSHLDSPSMLGSICHN